MEGDKNLLFKALTVTQDPANEFRGRHGSGMNPSIGHYQRRGPGNSERFGQFDVRIDFIGFALQTGNFFVGKGILEHSYRSMANDAL